MRSGFRSMAGVVLLAAVVSAAAERPNVLFIAVDDLNTCVTGFGGETTVPSPNIQRLAARGVRFVNAHCAALACNPSRASVMTGIAPYTSGVYRNSQDWRENRLLQNVTTLPQHFRDHGYKTLGGGKLYHASSLSQQAYTGFLDARPWDAYYPSKERQMPKEVAPERVPMHSNKVFYGGRFDWAALDIDINDMADAQVVAWAEQQLSQVHDSPLFLAVGIYRPHIPWWTPKPFFDQHPLDQIALPEVLANDLDDVPEAGRRMAKRHWHHQNHAIRSDTWRYIRYKDGAEELYDQRADPKNFHNLAGLAQYRAVKQTLMTRLPQHDAAPHPTANAQSRWRDTKKAKSKKVWK